jgi:tetratricopeptide (TPR) repeat protein
MSAGFRVFLSAVTSECGNARKLVASDLRSRGLEVRVQEDFRQEEGADTTLKKLHDYIKTCDAVVAIMGKRSGSFPPPAAAQPFKDMLPDGIERASMTQWEILFARKLGTRMSIYVASDRFVPAGEANPGDEPGSQLRLRDYLFEHQGLDRSEFHSAEDLSRLVLKETWPDHRAPKPKSDRFVSIGALFKGREEAIKRIEEKLSANRGASKPLALSGMGGIGKTQLAIEYGLAHKADYSALLFIAGETPAALDVNLQGLARVLGIPGQENLKEDRRRDAVLDWLRLNPGWFLVVDNVDTKDALKGAQGLIAHLSEGHAAITSRLSMFSSYFEPLTLDVLSVEASVEFLKERTRDRRLRASDEQSDARAISIDLGQLALGLECAGAYIAERGISFAEYRKHWADRRDKALEWRSDEVTYPRSIADAFLLSFAQLNPAGHELLQILAFFAPEPVQRDFLKAPIEGFEGDPADALVDVERYSLVRRNPERPEFTMHALVQDVARRGLIPEETDARCVAALAWLTAAVDPARRDKPGARRNVLLALDPHVEAAADHAASDRAREDARYLLVEAGDAFREAGYLGRAMRFHAKALECASAIAAAQPDDSGRLRAVAVSHQRIGDVLVSQGNLPKGLKSYRGYLEIAERLTQSDPGNTEWQRDLSVSCNKIGDVQAAQGDLAGALKSYNDGLEIINRLAQSDPGNREWRRDLSVSLNKIGDVQVAQGDLAGALRSYNDGLEIINLLAKSDPGNAGWRRDLSVSYNRIGEVHAAQGDLAGALKSYNDGLEIIKRLVQSDPGNAGWRRDLSVSYEKVGDAQVAQGDLAGALKSFSDSLAIRERLAQSDPGNAQWQRDLSVSYNKVGNAQFAQGDLVGALKSYRDSLAIRERLAQSDPGNTEWQRDLSASFEKVGDVRVARADLAGALKSFSDSLAIRNRLAKSDPGNARWQRDLSVSCNKIGNVQVAQGDLAGALKSYQADLAIADGLAKSDPGNAGWQRDLIVSCVKIAEVSPTEARIMLTRAGAIANRLRDEGRLAPVDAWMPEAFARRLAALPDGG